MYELNGAPNDGEPQGPGQEMGGVIEQVLPPDNNQVDAIAHLLATVEQLKEVVRE